MVSGVLFFIRSESNSYLFKGLLELYRKAIGFQELSGLLLIILRKGMAKGFI